VGAAEPAGDRGGTAPVRFRQSMIPKSGYRFSKKIMLRE
jgi:hypothetical protein